MSNLACRAMKDLLILIWHLIVTLSKLLRSGGTRAVVAENILLKQQLMVMGRSAKRSPKLTTYDRFILGLRTLFLSPSRITKAAVIIKPSTLLAFHKALVKRKYHRLFSAKRRKKSGPKGPSQEIINAIVEMKQRNPSFGCPRIAQQLAHIFGIDINKDVVRRVLEKHYRPASGDDGPSWLTFIGHMKDSLWSVDLFRCESVTLRSHWVMVVMDQFSRRIIGFAVQSGDCNGAAYCRMFNSIISGNSLPKYLSSDNDPLFRYHRWKANLRVLDIEEIKSVPYVPISHPFIERMIGSVRREHLDRTLFWNATDLTRKLEDFRKFYNQNRVHSSLSGKTPIDQSDGENVSLANLVDYNWKSHCRGLFHLPMPV
jgi:putative transposase